MSNNNSLEKEGRTLVTKEEATRGSKRKTAHEIVEEAYDKLVELKPTREEIQEFADKMRDIYGVVTYSKDYRKGSGKHDFLEYHDTWQLKFGGRVHIDVGYVDEKYIDKWNVPDTTHLMLDKNFASDFVSFIIQRRLEEAEEKKE